MKTLEDKSLKEIYVRCNSEHYHSSPCRAKDPRTINICSMTSMYKYLLFPVLLSETRDNSVSLQATVGMYEKTHKYLWERATGF